MRNSRLYYQRLGPAQPIPNLSIAEPFRAVVVADASVPADWRYEVSCWLVDGGCLYAMAWGKDCSKWEDDIDWASVLYEERNQGAGDNFLMTTAHADQPLSEVFWYSEFSAFDPEHDLATVPILHISDHDRKDYLIRMYHSQLEEGPPSKTE